MIYGDYIGPNHYIENAKKTNPVFLPDKVMSSINSKFFSSRFLEKFDKLNFLQQSLVYK